VSGTGDYILGVIGLVATALSVTIAGRAARRALLPGWAGPPALLADAVLAFGAFIAIAELLGLLGLFTGPLLVTLCVLVAAAALLGPWNATERAGPRTVALQVRDPAPAGAMRLSPALAVGAAIALIVVLQWSASTLLAWDRGIYGGDSLWYHMPFAAHIAQSGSVTELLYTDPLYLNWFYPQNSELLHAAGIELFGDDFLSPLLNLGWLALALLAGWCVGRPYRAGAGTLAAVAALMSTNLLFSRQPGNAHNDVAALALLLAAAALLLEAARRTRAQPAADDGSAAGKLTLPGLAPGAVFVAGLAAGLALGTKLTVVVPVAVLTVGVVVIAADARLRTAACWGGGLLLGGGYWYLRNLIVSGNPLPWLDLGPLPKAEELKGRDPFSIAHYLTDTDVWGTYFIPGVHERFGDLWPLLLALAVGGVAVALLRRRPLELLLAAVAVVSAIAYIFTPLSAAGPEGDPIAFRVNIRYLAPALMLALPLIALPPPFARRFRSAWVIGAVAAFAAVIVIGDRALGAVELDRLPGEALLAAAAVVVPTLALLLLGHGRSAAVVAAGVGAVVLVLAVVGRSTEDTYLDYRYSSASPDFPREEHLPGAGAGSEIQLEHGLGGANDWARGVAEARIALTGTEVALFQYGLWGLDSSNEVSYLGRRGDRGSFEALDGCPEFVEALGAGDYDYLVTSPYFDQDRPRESTLPPEHFWLERSGAERVAGGPLIEVWALDRPLDARVCAMGRR
jgi:hypothetical protein